MSAFDARYDRSYADNGHWAARSEPAIVDPFRSLVAQAIRKYLSPHVCVGVCEQPARNFHESPAVVHILVAARNCSEHRVMTRPYASTMMADASMPKARNAIPAV